MCEQIQIQNRKYKESLSVRKSLNNKFPVINLQGQIFFGLYMNTQDYELTKKLLYLFSEFSSFFSYSDIYTSIPIGVRDNLF